MRTELPSNKPAVFAAERERKVRALVKRFGGWRKDAWPILFAELSREGHGFRTCAPGACLVYIAIVSIMLEYLGAKPDQKQFLELRTRMSIDLANLRTYAYELSKRVSLEGNDAYTDEEKSAFLEAIRYVSGAVEQVSVFCPGVSRT